MNKHGRQGVHGLLDNTLSAHGSPFPPKAVKAKKHTPSSGKTENGARAGAAHGHDKIRWCAHSLALFLRPHSCVAPAAAEERGRPGNNALDRQPRGRDGSQPSAQATTISLISEPRSLDIRSSEMWKTRTTSFQSQLVQKEFTVDFWHGPKDREFKRGD